VVIRASITAFIDAPVEEVRRLYLAPGNWPRIFGNTIRSARVIARDADTTIVEVEHVEGRVINVLRQLSPGRIELREFKRRHDATFVNQFSAAGAGTRYTLDARVTLKGPYRLIRRFSSPSSWRGCAATSSIRSGRRLSTVSRIRGALL
jgi:hypothetical protein